MAPPRLAMTRGRRRQVDTSSHFCPNPDCRYQGDVGWGNLRANGHPNGGNCCVSPVTAIFWRPSARSFMGSVPSSNSSCACSRAWPKTSYHLSTPICQIFTPFARLAHGDFGWHHSRCDHATSRSGYAAAGLQRCVKLGHAAGLWPAEPHTRRRNRHHVAWRLAPCDKGHGANAGYNRAASRLVGACHFAW